MGSQRSVYIPEELWAQLQSFCAKQTGFKISNSAVICRAVKEFLEKENVK